MSGQPPITPAEDSGSDPEQEIPSMSPEDLRALIEGDAMASQMVSTGNWEGCAARCVEIAPHVVIRINLDSRGIIATATTAAEAAAIITTLNQVRQLEPLNPVLAELLPYLKIPSASGGGLDFGNPLLRGLLTAAPEQGGCGLTAEQAAPLLRIAERPQTISPLECRVAMTGA